MINKKIKLSVAFTLFFFCWFMVAANLESVPRPGPVKKSKGTEQRANSETGSGATIASNSDDSGNGSGIVERAGKPSTREVKKKKFPWLIVAVVAVAGAALFYFLVINKKYTLTTTVGDGVEGKPLAGTQKFKKNETVAYEYLLKPGFKDLMVKVDGVKAETSGSVKMDRNHTIDASAIQAAQVSVNSTPSGAQVYADGANTGKTTPCTLNYDSAGSHVILVRLCGYKDYVVTVQAVMGTDTPVNAGLVAGHKEDFDVEAATCWQPMQPGDWKVQNGSYFWGANVTFANHNLLNLLWPSSTYTVTTRALRHLGRKDVLDNGILLITDPGTLPEARGYMFGYMANNTYQITRLDGFNFATGNGSYAWIKPWTLTAAINGGLDAWNTLRVVRNGGSYAFYINDILVWSYIGETTYDPRYVALAVVSYGTYTELNFDYVYVNPGTATGLVPGNLVTILPAGGGNPLFKK